MAAEAGLKTYETDALSPSEVWIHYDGYVRRIRVQWEMTRAICFNVAMFGNCDIKKMPKKAQRFMPFGWDQKGAKLSDDILKQHEKKLALRQRLENKLNNAS